MTPTPTGGINGESLTMGESLIWQYGVIEEGQYNLYSSFIKCAIMISPD